MRRACLVFALLLAVLLPSAPAFSQPASGLIAAYAFDEAMGGVTSDASGYGNSASISGASWTTGRFGAALAFDGADSRVIGPAVTLGSTFTLMAWVYSPAPRAYATIVTVGSARDLYLSNGVVTFWDGATERAFGTALSSNAWHHVALVYDGASLSAYVDGTRQDVSLPAELPSVSGILQIGALSLEQANYDFFYGAIDEVRVYSRALAQGEIQRDMATPVSNPPADTTPPTVSMTAPGDGTSASGTIVVGADAGDEVAVAGVQFLLDGVNLGAETLSPPYAVTWDTTQVANGPHTLTARARDAAGNQATAAPITVSVDNGGGGSPGYALRFYGNGVNDIDRVKIPIDAPERPADVGADDFTLEFWMKALAAENGSGSCRPGDDGWILGNVMFDRDVTYAGDFGDFGISLAGGRIAVGANNGSVGAGICGAQSVADGVWHHVAVTRSAATGQLRIFVDGGLDAEGAGPLGDLSYRNGRPTNFPSDRYLVIGAEKADAGPAYPSYSGWIDEVRISDVVRYTTSFARPTAPFVTDANTMALYHFDEGGGDVVGDSSGAPGGPSDGLRKFGGSPAGPEWVTDSPFRR